MTSTVPRSALAGTLTVVVAVLVVLSPPGGVRGHAADCNANGIADAQDISGGSSLDCNQNGVPDECDLADPLPFFQGGPELSLLRPEKLIAAELDGNGLGDLVVLGWADENGSQKRLTILLGDGTGRFQQGGALLFSRLHSCVCGDFDGDGDTDMAVATEPDLLTVLLNDGTGRGWTRLDSDVGLAVTMLASGDLDGDGDLDLAVQVYNPSGSVSFSAYTLLNGGDGTFTAGAELAAPNLLGVGAVKVADLDDDGDLDVLLGGQALAGGNLVLRKLLLRNRGDATFASPALLAGWDNYGTSVLEDLDGDGRVDIARSDSLRGIVQILLQRSGGTLAVASTLTGSYLSGPAGDFDGDGLTDLFGEQPGVGFVLFRNLGGGAFRVLGASEVSDAELAVSVLEPVDLDGDGDDDLASPFLYGDMVGIYLAEPRPYSTDLNGNGVPDDCEDCNANGNPDELDIAEGTSADCNGNGSPDECDVSLGVSPDCNGNGIPDSCDIAGGTSADCNQNGLPDECDLLPSIQFASLEPLSVEGTPEGIVVADFDEDGLPDLATANYSPGDVAVSLGRPGGEFERTLRRYPAGAGATSLAAADLDRDGHLDLACANQEAGTISVLRGDGKGGFVPYGTYPSGTQPAGDRQPLWVTAADLDGDRDLDLAVANSVLFKGSGSGVAILWNDGGGLFPTTSELEAGDKPSSIAAGDLDEDGDTDLAVANMGSSNVTVFLQRNDGAFDARPFRAGGNPTCILLADLDGDFDLDVATANWGLRGGSPRGITLLRNDGSGALSGRLSVDTDVPTSSVTAMDLDGDGLLDLAGTAFSGSQGGTVGLFRNLGDWRFDPPVRVAAGASPLKAVAADLDLDGDVDLAIANQTSPEDNVTLPRNDTLLPSSRDCNRNAIPDECELEAVICDPVFLRADCNEDGNFDISDAIATLGTLFLGERAPYCDDACDSNDDGAVDISDAIRSLGVLFLGEGSIPPPGIDACGVDPTEDDTGCRRYAACP